jgi:hypothetical protein
LFKDFCGWWHLTAAKQVRQLSTDKQMINLMDHEAPSQGFETLASTSLRAGQALYEAERSHSIEVLLVAPSAPPLWVEGDGRILWMVVGLRPGAWDHAFKWSPGPDPVPSHILRNQTTMRLPVVRSDTHGRRPTWWCEAASRSAHDQGGSAQ